MLQQKLSEINNASSADRHYMLELFQDLAVRAMSDRLGLTKSVHDRGNGFTLRPSNIGLPIRELAYGKLYGDETDETEGCDLDELFLDGNLTEAVFSSYIHYLYPAGDVELQRAVSYNGLSGHADIVVEDVVYDIKSTILGGKLRRSSSSGQWNEGQQVVGVTNPCHLMQVALYAKGLSLQDAGFIIIDKICKRPTVITLEPSLVTTLVNLIDRKLELLRSIVTLDDIANLPFPQMELRRGKWKLPSYLRNYGRHWDKYLAVDESGIVSHYVGVRGERYEL